MPHSAENYSEVARLRERVAREYEAASWAQLGLAVGTAKHRFITRRYERIGFCQEQLATMIGEQASLALVLEVIEGSPLQKRGV